MSSKTRFTIADLQRSKVGHLNTHITGAELGTNKAKRLPVVKKPSKAKAFILKNLHYWCNDRNLVLIPELEFKNGRKWRFDFAIVKSLSAKILLESPHIRDAITGNIRIAIEYEGIFNGKSRHTTVTGFTGDVEKYNAAAGEGWKVLRYTAKNYTNLLTDLNKQYELLNS